MAQLISGQLIKYAITSSINLLLYTTYANPSNKIVGFTSASSNSGTAFRYSNYGVFVNHNVSNATIIATAKGANTITTGGLSATEWLYPTISLYRNGKKIHSGGWTVKGHDAGWISGSVSITTKLSAGDQINMYVSEEQAVHSHSAMSDFVLKISATT